MIFIRFITNWLLTSLLIALIIIGLICFIVIFPVMAIFDDRAHDLYVKSWIWE